MYLYPAFDKANEAHLRLGIMAKVNGDFDISLMHLNMALNDTSTCMFSSLEIKFHIAHVNEVRGESHKAKELYEELLQEPEISANLKSDVLRQLGWMFHCIEALGERNTRLHTAIQYLKESNECSAKKNHGKTLYLLGRCSAGEKKFIYDLVIRFHEKFLFSIFKTQRYLCNDKTCAMIYDHMTNLNYIYAHNV